MKQYNNIIKKLDSFIKKYYKVKLIRGLILSVSIILGIYLIFSVSEFYLRFSSVSRAILFFTFLALLIGTFLWLIIIPVLKLIKIGKLISYKDASDIIVKHFPDIKDKLINTLELYELQKNKKNDIKLIDASIDQKSEQIKIFSFKKAVKHKQNFKYLKYSIPVLLIFIAIIAISPSVLEESNKRIINYDKKYELPAPFFFRLINDTLNYKKGDNVTIKVKLAGEYIPDEVFINYMGNNFLMKKSKKNKSQFSYEFKNLNNSVKFWFSAQNLESEKYNINILPSPSVINFFVNVDVPSYTNEKDTVFKNKGDIVVPYGSKISWIFKTGNVDSLCLFSGNEKIKTKKENDLFYYSKRIFKNFNYSVTAANKYFVNHNLINFNISVIPDLFPSVDVKEIKDTANYYISYYRGIINDDYGFKRLNFKYRIVPKETETSNLNFKYKKNPLQIINNQIKQEFYYSFDFSTINNDENKIIQYYFEVWDNDGVRGSKSSRTGIMTFKIPSYKEIKEFENTANENIQSKLEKSIRLADEIQKDLELLRERNLDGNISDWENKQMLQNILEKQNLLKNMTNELSQENKEKNKMQNKLNEKDEELIKKQKEIQELLEEIMTDELKELMKQLQELQDKFNEKMMNKLLEDYKFSHEEMSERLDRTKELLKREQIEQKINNAIKELEKLAEEQKDLSKETKDKDLNKEELKNKQKNIEERFKDIQEEYDEAKELNKELKKEMKLSDFNEDNKKIEEEFQESEENLDKGKNKKASDSQNQNSQNMKNLSKSMQSMMQSNSMQQQGEDIDAMRQILDNLLTFSFAQESLTDEFPKIRTNDPKYIELSDKQLSMKDDFVTIEDSLKSLANRVTQISKPILDEVYKINNNLRDVQKKLEERKISDSRNLQNKIMTSSNNLALLLSEIIKQMKNQMQGSSGGGSQCKNKKKGKKDAFQDLKGSQQSLKEQMEKMLKQMKDGTGSFNENAQNKQLAKMLAQQEIFRQMLKEMNANFSLNPETQKLLNQINKMAEENEKDIVNRRINPELINRQKKIETRLLEAENAENKRKTDNKRKSTEGNDKIYKSAEDVFKDAKDKNSFNEDLYRKNIQLKNFYKKLYDDYSKSVNK
ncbi:MAG: hypothetical protein K8R54_17680 [Bacteroidales bacterium]|nr:hypothetical protein [Bacteroidales bacterium]